MHFVRAGACFTNVQVLAIHRLYRRAKVHCTLDQMRPPPG